MPPDNKRVFKSQDIQLYLGDCLTMLKTIPRKSIDAIVTDPPAGIAFMGKDWDRDKGGRDQWILWMEKVAGKCYRVIKPGGHCLVWALPRTSHWTATAWENAGFEVRDCIAHAFGSGFPKSTDISKQIDKMKGAEREVIGVDRHSANRTKPGRFSDENEGVRTVSAPTTPEAKHWQGFGTALKPAIEDWWLLRKPIEKGLTVAQNCLKWGVGALDIDGGRIEVDPDDPNARKNKAQINKFGGVVWGHGGGADWPKPQGRFPAHLIHDGSDEVVGMFPDNVRMASDPSKVKQLEKFRFMEDKKQRQTNVPEIKGSAARFFYCAKPSKAERGPNNDHPTVKSLALMQYLIKLISRKNQIVLDPFMGSGTTGIACVKTKRKFIGIESEEEYFNIAKRRIHNVG